MQTFARWIALPENRSAQAAAERVSEAVCTRRLSCGFNPLFIHGPPGTGKSHLVSALIAAITIRSPDRIVVQKAAGDFVPSRSDDEANNEDFAAARNADLLVIEDVQHLPERAIETVVHLLDQGLARGQQWVVTATEGPARLQRLPSRLSSRLAGGLVVGLALPSPDSRRAALATLADQCGLRVPTDVLDWIAGHVAGSFRELEGSVARLAMLARLHGGKLSLDMAQEQFQAESNARRPTVKRIVQRVGRYFRVDPDQLQGPSRTRGVLLPRQVGMYLARRLTALSLEQIGACFGGRDHSTVLHACRKIEEALDRDANLSGAVRQLHADLA